MSICLAESAIGIRGPIMYVIVGRVKKSDQVFRPVAFRSDFTLLPPGIAAGEATVVAAEEMFAPYDKRRPRKGALLTLSFPPDEFDVMKTHTTIGAEVLANSNIAHMQTAEEIARHHHH